MYELAVLADPVVRDAADLRVIAGVKDRTHRRIDSQNEVGGWPELAPGTSVKDSDGDGMSDEWEKEHGLNAADSSDGNATQEDGYTNLEKYLNSLVGEYQMPAKK